MSETTTNQKNHKNWNIKNYAKKNSNIKLYMNEQMYNTCLETLKKLVEEKIASRIKNKDYTIWGVEAQAESKIRLGWTNATEKSNKLYEQLLPYSKKNQELTNVVLAGMGGSSLAPEVICNAYNKHITILDSTHPEQVVQAIDNLEKTLLVVSSKSGSTVETDSALKTFEKEFIKYNLDPSKHIVIVTDPNSPLEKYAETQKYTVFHGDAKVGGRFSALTAFGLVPSQLAGVHTEEIIAQAKENEAILYSDTLENPALLLGIALAYNKVQNNSQHMHKTLLSSDKKLGNFSDWAEQLIAESTGKIGKGILPIVTNNPVELKYDIQDILPIFIKSNCHEEKTQECAQNISAIQERESVELHANLGTQFLLWEIAVAVASYIIGVPPFDQPDVESAKIASRKLLTEKNHANQEDMTQLYETTANNIDNYTDTDSLQEKVAKLFKQLGKNSYLSLMVYANRNNENFDNLRDTLADTLKIPVTFGWGPRFLHSTGQLHKGGEKCGVFLQIQITSCKDLEIPGRHFSYETLLTSQAKGDAQVLSDLGLPILRIRCKDNSTNIMQIILEATKLI